jgi:hypothetical protein
LGIRAELKHYNCKKFLQTHYSITPLFHYSNWGEAPKSYTINGYKMACGLVMEPRLNIKYGFSPDGIKRKINSIPLFAY